MAQLPFHSLDVALPTDARVTVRAGSDGAGRRRSWVRLARRFDDFGGFITRSAVPRGRRETGSSSESTGGLHVGIARRTVARERAESKTLKGNGSWKCTRRKHDSNRVRTAPSETPEGAGPQRPLPASPARSPSTQTRPVACRQLPSSTLKSFPSSWKIEEACMQAIHRTLLQSFR